MARTMHPFAFHGITGITQVQRGLRQKNRFAEGVQIKETMKDILKEMKLLNDKVTLLKTNVKAGKDLPVDECSKDLSEETVSLGEAVNEEAKAKEANSRELTTESDTDSLRDIGKIGCIELEMKTLKEDVGAPTTDIKTIPGPGVKEDEIIPSILKDIKSIKQDVHLAQGHIVGMATELKSLRQISLKLFTA